MNSCTLENIHGKNIEAELKGQSNEAKAVLHVVSFRGAVGVNLFPDSARDHGQVAAGRGVQDRGNVLPVDVPCAQEQEQLTDHRNVEQDAGCAIDYPRSVAVLRKALEAPLRRDEADPADGVGPVGVAYHEVAALGVERLLPERLLVHAAEPQEADDGGVEEPDGKGREGVGGQVAELVGVEEPGGVGGAQNNGQCPAVHPE